MIAPITCRAWAGTAVDVDHVATDYRAAVVLVGEGCVTAATNPETCARALSDATPAGSSAVAGRVGAGNGQNTLAGRSRDSAVLSRQRRFEPVRATPSRHRAQRSVCRACCSRDASRMPALPTPRGGPLGAARSNRGGRVGRGDGRGSCRQPRDCRVLGAE